MKLGGGCRVRITETLKIDPHICFKWQKYTLEWAGLAMLPMLVVDKKAVMGVKTFLLYF